MSTDTKMLNLLAAKVREVHRLVRETTEAIIHEQTDRSGYR